MNRRCTICALALAALLLTACSSEAAGPPSPTPGEEEPLPGDFSTDVYRIVDGAETGLLLLAGTEGGAGSVFTLDVSDLDLAQPLADGMLVDVTHNCVVQETFPLQWSAGAVQDVRPTEGQTTDDRFGLCLQVLEDLWAVDPGLNEGITELGVDFSGLTGFTDSEKAAVAYAFGMAHGIMPITGTYEELVEQGYIDGEELLWDDGCLFSITGSLEEGFEAQKWRSGLGAYFYTDCTAKMAKDGTWSYEIGGEAIS